MTALDALRAAVEGRKADLDRLRPLAPGALEALRHVYDVELTYTSNAIEGNTLTHRETAELIEHGITVGGKPLRDHLEAEDHYAAVGWMRALAAGGEPLGEVTVTELHRRIVLRSQPAIGGVYSQFRRRIAGSPVIFPNPSKIPELMTAFGAWLAQSQPTPEAAFLAQFDFVSVHPFSDGNGRTARLLMNLLLLRGGWPPIAIRPEDRAAYLGALEEAHLSGDRKLFLILMFERLDATLIDYVDALREGGAD